MYVIWCFQLTRCSIPKKRSNCTLRSHCESFSSLLSAACVCVCVLRWLCMYVCVCVCGTQIHTVSGRESFCSSCLWHPPTPGLRRETAYHQRQPTPPNTIPNTTTPHHTIGLILTLHCPPPPLFDSLLLFHQARHHCPLSSFAAWQLFFLFSLLALFFFHCFWHFCPKYLA